MQAGFHFHDLAGRTLLITGITQGIGRSLLSGFLAQGMRIVALSKGMDDMREVRRSVTSDEDRIRLFECDLADARQVSEVAEEILAEGIELDAMVHNAAIDPRRSFEDSDEAFWSELFQVNLFSAVSLTRRLLPLLRRSDQGRIVFTGSVVADLGVSHLGAYAASKGALVALGRSLAHELKGTGITVNCLQPGAVKVEKEKPSPSDEALLIDWQAVSRRVTPDDLLGLLSLLLSKAGGAMTGQVFTVDGGLTHPLASAAVQSRVAPC
jgi:NAD(P)-dependent dehydrogenase (short-subunit alcohol dehydrogenase family)